MDEARNSIFGRCGVKLLAMKCAAQSKEEHDRSVSSQDQALMTVLKSVPAAAKALDDAHMGESEEHKPIGMIKKAIEMDKLD